MGNLFNIFLNIINTFFGVGIGFTMLCLFSFFVVLAILISLLKR